MPIEGSAAAALGELEHSTDLGVVQAVAEGIDVASCRLLFFHTNDLERLHRVR